MHFIKTLGGTNFRSGPSTGDSIIRWLPRGTVVEVLAEVPGVTWYEAKLEDGTKGYITSLAKYVVDFVPDWLQVAINVKNYGKQYLGVPYVFGSTRTTDKSFDCSDFQQWIFGHAADINLHWDSRSQCKYDGEEVPLEQLAPGDLVFFSHDGTDGGVYHVAQYVGDDKLFHTYSTTSAVKDENLVIIRKTGGGVTFTPYPGYWKNIAYKAKRVISRQ